MIQQIPKPFPVSSVIWLYWLLTLNSAVNPFVYMAFNRELRRPIKRLVKRCCCCCCGKDGDGDSINAV